MKKLIIALLTVWSSTLLADSQAENLRNCSSGLGIGDNLFGGKDIYAWEDSENSWGSNLAASKNGSLSLYVFNEKSASKITAKGLSNGSYQYFQNGFVHITGTTPFGYYTNEVPIAYDKTELKEDGANILATLAEARYGKGERTQEQQMKELEQYVLSRGGVNLNGKTIRPIDPSKVDAMSTKINIAIDELAACHKLDNAKLTEIANSRLADLKAQESRLADLGKQADAAAKCLVTAEAEASGAATSKTR